MQRFELIEGASSKFWEVDVAGTDLTVRFGRIGTDGQTKTKSFADAAAATKERDKLVKEKTGKGYGAVGVAEGTVLAPAPAPAAAAAPTPPKAAPNAEPTASARNASPVIEAAAPSASVRTAAASSPASAPSPDTAPLPLTWPSGGFQWNPEWHKLLPTMRGVNAPPVEPSLSLLSNIPGLKNTDLGYYVQDFESVVAASGRPWTVWQSHDAKQHLTRPNLMKRDDDFWLELLAQTHLIRQRDTQAHWALKVGLAVHGLPFMLKAMLELCDLMRDKPHGLLDAMRLMRRAIACAPDDVYAEALALAEQARLRNPEMALQCCNLFPHLTAWALECVEAQVPDPSCLLDLTALPTEVLAKHLTRVGINHYQFKATIALQVKLHGDAAMDLLALDFQRSRDRYNLVNALEQLQHMHLPALVPTLLSRVEEREVRTALEALSVHHPVAVLKSAIERSLVLRSHTVESWTVRLALRDAAVLAAALTHLSDGDRSRFEQLLASLQRADASVEELPAFLRSPPWLQKARAQALPTLDIALPAETLRLEWSEAQITQHAKPRPHGRLTQVLATRSDARTYCLAKMHIVASAHERVLAGGPLQPEDVVVPASFYGCDPDHLLPLEPAVALAVWNSYPMRHWHSWDLFSLVQHFLALYGEAALPGLKNYLQAYPENALELVSQVDSSVIVPTALHALRKMKRAKPNAIAWIRNHLASTLPVALAFAFGKDKSAREDGQHALRWLAAQGHDAALQAAAAAQSSPMTEALNTLLSADPLLVLPARIPKLPSFFVGPALRRPELRTGGALPITVMDHVATMLALSTLDAPYAGVTLLRDLCTPNSLADFAWDLFDAWLAVGGPAKENWAFIALGLLGNDDTARRLSPLIREWPGEAAHQRAVTGLSLLEAIGTDVALMHLNGIASKVKFKGLQEKAQEKIAAIAETRGLTSDELADRLVPDLGLDDNGLLQLDFGPRQFVVGFDESLKPFVKDLQGSRLKDLPKPIKSDDAALAEAATERFKQLKKDAKALGSLQLVRLELGMVSQRRWSATDFRLFFLDHPLMRHLAARVVWGVYADQAFTQGFRVAEDWSLADEHDTHFDLPGDAVVGIAHVLEMPPSAQAAFGQVFADYEILQPFKQLGRETHALTDDERTGKEITRFKDKVVSIGSVMGLVNRGWERGRAEDGGWVHEFHRAAGGGLQIDLQLDPGTVIGDLSYEPKQRLPSITLRQPGTWDADGLRAFSHLSAIAASEMLRDIDLLAPLVEAP
ncbi:MAG: hypothetical protein RLZZ618_464 [Pseudomonadota bacterium]|jgi:predicted DNA-binding WGR domain protein